jgi:hypothetical protein
MGDMPIGLVRRVVVVEWEWPCRGRAVRAGAPCRHGGWLFAPSVLGHLATVEDITADVLAGTIHRHSLVG